MHICCVLSASPIQTITVIFRHEVPLLTSHTAQNTTCYVVCCRHGRHSYICVHMEVHPHRFANSHLLELCGNLQHWKLSWTLKDVPDTSMSDVCPKHLVSAGFPWSLAIFCYFLLNFPYYLRQYNTTVTSSSPKTTKQNNNNQLINLTLIKKPNVSSWRVIYSHKWRDLCLPYRVKSFLHVTIYNKLSRYPLSCLNYVILFWFDLVWFGLFFIHSVTHVTLDMSITD